MKILTVYSTLTGNTEKIAKAIASAFQGSEIRKLPTDLNPGDFDLIFAGFWCDKGQPDEVWAEFFKKIGNTPTAVFGTLGGDPAGERAKAFADKVKANFARPNLLGLRLWQGRVDPKILEFMAKMPGAAPMTEERKARLAEAARHPTAEDCVEAAAWAIEMAESAGQLAGK